MLLNLTSWWLLNLAFELAIGLKVILHIHITVTILVRFYATNRTRDVIIGAVQLFMDDWVLTEQRYFRLLNLLLLNSVGRVGSIFFFFDNEQASPTWIQEAMILKQWTLSPSHLLFCRAFISFNDLMRWFLLWKSRFNKVVINQFKNLVLLFLLFLYPWLVTYFCFFMHIVYYISLQQLSDELLIFSHLWLLYRFVFFYL